MEKSVSILKESRDGDKRVILLPEQVKQFIDAGFKVFVEHNAGIELQCQDQDYESAGATVVSTEEAWTVSDFVIKCRCPSEEEWCFFRPGLNLGSTFYVGDKEPLAQALIENRVNAYSYELFRTVDGIFPLMTSDSEISGHMAIIYGAYHLQTPFGGSGVMLGRIPGAKPAKVVVIGYGNAGGAAARAAAALGAEVVVLGMNRAKLRKFQSTVPQIAQCYINSPEVLEREIPDADLVVGAILISIHDTQPMIDLDLLKKMKKGSVIVDVTCGYGKGFLPTAYKKTRDLEEAYFVEGIKHFKNDCMPKLVHMTATPATSSNAIHYLINWGQSIYEEGFLDPVSEAGLVVSSGEIRHPQIIRELSTKKAVLDSSV